MRARLLAALLVAAAAVPMLVPAGSGAAALSPAGRQSRTSDVAIAGGDIYLWSSHTPEGSGSGCTVSFAVRSRKTGARGFLTAGHCVATLPGGPAYLVHQTKSLAGDDTEPGDLLGRVTRSNYRLGPDGDSAYVQLAPGVSARPSLFTGGTRSHTTIPVVALGAPATGEEVCYSGAATGLHCGFTIVGGSQTVSFKSAHSGTVSIAHEWRATAAPGRTCTSEKGDSGSPVFTMSGGTATAVGILSGGQVRQGTCPFYFTPVKLALSELGLTLVKSSSSSS